MAAERALTIVTASDPDLHTQRRYKPVGLVSHGGVAAGTRAVAQLKQSPPR